MLEKVSRWCLFLFKNEVFYDLRIKKRLKKCHGGQYSGLWSKGIRCESGTVPAAVNPDMLLHDVIAAGELGWFRGCEKARKFSDRSC